MVLKSSHCCPYLKNIIQSYVSKTFPSCSQNIGGFLYLVLLIPLNLGIFHQSILLFFTHFFKLFLCIFKFPNISMEKGNMDDKLIPKHEKEFFTRQIFFTRQTKLGTAIVGVYFKFYILQHMLGSNGNPQIMTEASCLSFPGKGQNWNVTEHI